MNVMQGLRYERKNARGGNVVDDDEPMLQVKKLVENIGAGFEGFRTEIKERVDGLEAWMVKTNRPGSGAGTGSIPAAERKSLETAVRALIVGDQKAADEAFREAKAMLVGSDPDGGYVTHSVMSATMTQVMQEISPFYRLARRVPLKKGDAFEEPVDRDTAGATWVGETEARPDTTTPKLGMFRVELNEIYAQPKLSQKLIDTADIDVVAWLSSKVGEAFAVKEGTAFHSGDGVGKPRGVLTYPVAATADATRAWGTIQYIATGASGAFLAPSSTVNPADVLVDLTMALKAQYRSGATWMMNRATAGVVRKMKDAEGRYLWVDSLTQGAPAVLLGFPVELSEEMPDIGANTLSIAFGNVERAYTIVEGVGTKFLTDPYTDKPNVKLFAYRRVGGGLNNSEALKFLKFGTS